MGRRITITQFFEDLDAPLTNQQWSWGAVRRDGTVFFRVWDDQITADEALLPGPHRPRTQKQGLAERYDQIERVRAGAPCYLVVLKAVDTEASPRKIASFDRHELLIGGRIIERDGRIFIEVTGRTTPHSVRQGNRKVKLAEQ
jgi:hypothetical protein